MKIKYLKKNTENTRLILIAAGWTAGPEIATHISMPGWDVAVMYDFTDLNFNNALIEDYYTIYLYAWSLGVYAASKVLNPERITCAFAINGTLIPVDDTTGIPEAIFKGTRDSLTERNLLKFRMRMTGNIEQARALTETGINSIPNLKDQLDTILGSTQAPSKNCKALPWTRIFISEDDRIFPPENQRRAWAIEKEAEIVELSGPHYVDLKDIVRMTIADTEAVSKRFSKAFMTYDTHAIAQYSSAIKLASLLRDSGSLEKVETLEIGCGTGLFTREYSRIIKPEKAVFVDITETGPFDIATVEEYYVEDAERWIETHPEKFDFILSASCIQWFADIPRFLQLCSQRLKPNGVLAISTFLPGNMEELDSIRPNPLRYPTANQLYEWLIRDYENVKVIEDEIKIEFQSFREMLMHLKHTGVAGSAPSSRKGIKDMSHLRSLTYRPVYMTATKK